MKIEVNGQGVGYWPNKVQAVKAFRNITNLGLKESKEASEYGGVFEVRSALSEAGVRDLILEGNLSAKILRGDRAGAFSDVMRALDALDTTSQRAVLKAAMELLA